MNWTFENDITIKHSEGHSLRLALGQWLDPKLVIPKISRSLPEVERVQLIQEGLEYAQNKQNRNSENKHTEEALEA